MCSAEVMKAWKADYFPLGYSRNSFTVRGEKGSVHARLYTQTQSPAVHFCECVCVREGGGSEVGLYSRLIYRSRPFRLWVMLLPHRNGCLFPWRHWDNNSASSGEMAVGYFFAFVSALQRAGCLQACCPVFWLLCASPSSLVCPAVHSAIVCVRVGV